MDPFSMYSGGESLSGMGRRRNRRGGDSYMSESRGAPGDASGRETYGPAGVLNNDELNVPGNVFKPSRAPRDPAPYYARADDDGEDADRCVACEYVASSSGDTTSESADALQQLHDIILKTHNCKCSDAQLVEIVHEFYENEIRKWNDHLGPWSRKSIYEHIYHHMGEPDVQIAGNIQMLQFQIDSLRGVAWQKNTETGEYTPHLGNIKAMVDLISRHQALVDSRKRKK
jgi:hypothetical protein